MTRTAIFCNGL